MPQTINPGLLTTAGGNNLNVATGGGLWGNELLGGRGSTANVYGQNLMNMQQSPYGVQRNLGVGALQNLYGPGANQGFGNLMQGGGFGAAANQWGA